jgi:hypothetical protein
LIVEELSSFALGKGDVNEIAKKTLYQVRDRFNKLENDPSVKATFEFLVQVSYAFQHENPTKYLVDRNILEKEELSVLKLARAINSYKSEELQSHEYQSFARQAAIDAINNWYSSNLDQGVSLFSKGIEPENVFSKAGSGSGFCEISRLFFSKFTERYLKYFLEREASSKITNIKARDRFNKEIEDHVDEISRHAFESSKITQSYAAGWYNKHSKDKLPNEADIQKLINRTFGKMRSELLHEEIN